MRDVIRKELLDPKGVAHQKLADKLGLKLGQPADQAKWERFLESVDAKLDDLVVRIDNV